MVSIIRTACLTVACLAMGIWAAPPGWATAQQTFRVSTTHDLIDLCATPDTDPLYTAAVNFCEGFLVGAYQYHEVAVKAEGQRRLVCPPNPAPTRNESVARFIQWSRSHPSALATPPVEGMFEFLSQAYPCTG